MTALLILILIGFAVTLLMVSTARERSVGAVDPSRGEQERDLTPSEIRAGKAKLAVTEWRVHPTDDSERTLKSGTFGQ